MNTCRIAITIPINLLNTIDLLAKKLHISRSKLISEGAMTITKLHQQKNIAAKYNEIFSDTKTNKDQIKTSEAFLNLNEHIEDEY